MPPTQNGSLPSALGSLQKGLNEESSDNAAATPSGAILTPAYRLEVVRRILRMTSLDTYTNITDFDWYLSVLIDLTYVSNVDVGERIKDIVLDVVSRVPSVRPSAVGLLSRLLEDGTFLDNAASEDATCGEVIAAAAWVCGEYSR